MYLKSSEPRNHGDRGLIKTSYPAEFILQATWMLKKMSQS